MSRTPEGFEFRVPKKSYSSRLLAGSLRHKLNDLKIRRGLAEAIVESMEEIFRARAERLAAMRDDEEPS